MKVLCFKQKPLLIADERFSLETSSSFLLRTEAALEVVLMLLSTT